jgi:hypothetical protein
MLLYRPEELRGEPLRERERQLREMRELLRHFPESIPEAPKRAR